MADVSLLILPIALLLIGGMSVIFPQQVANRTRKAAKWSTFGLSELKWFRGADDDMPFFVRLTGAGFLLGGIFFLIVYIFSFFGPGTSCALREAGRYLQRTYGTALSQRISAGSETADGTIVTVTYTHGPRSGELRGEWNGKNYVFSEEKSR